MQAQARRVLIVIDVQNEYFTGNLPIEYPPTSVSLPNIVQAMDAAHAAGIPVIVVQHDAPAGSPVFAVDSAGWQLHPQVATRPADHRIHKKQASVFAGTELEKLLSEMKIDTLSIIGYMTHNCNAGTVYHAAHAGYRVEHLSDATGALPYSNDAGSATAEEIHRVFNTVFHSNFATVMTTAAWIAAVREARIVEHDNVYVSNLRARSA